MFPQQASIISHADHEVQSTGSYARVEGREGGVFSCEVGVSSSPVWGWGAAVCGPHLYTPAGVPVPVPEAARHTAGRPAALEDCSSLETSRRVEGVGIIHMYTSAVAGLIMIVCITRSLALLYALIHFKPGSRPLNGCPRQFFSNSNRIIK